MKNKKLKLGLIISSIALVTMGGGIGIGYAIGHNNKSSNYEKDFYTMDEFMNFAKESYIIKDKQTFKDGYESGAWFDNNMKAEWIAHIIARNVFKFWDLSEYISVDHAWINISKIKSFDWTDIGWYVNCGFHGNLPTDENIVGDFDFLTLTGVKMYCLHNAKSGDGPQNGVWFNVVPIMFNGDYDDLASSYPVGVTIANIDGQTVSTEEITSDALALQIPDDWIPNITLDY